MSILQKTLVCSFFLFFVHGITFSKSAIILQVLLAIQDLLNHPNAEDLKQSEAYYIFMYVPFKSNFLFFRDFSQITLFKNIMKIMFVYIFMSLFLVETKLNTKGE